MSTTMTATLKVATSGLGTTSVTRSVQVGAFDHVEVTVPATGDGGTVTAEVHPGGTGQARLVMLTASAYPLDPADETPQLTFTVDVDGTDTVLPLDGPLLLAGASIADLLGDMQEVAFTNASDTAIDVTILVGRNAEAPPPP